MPKLECVRLVLAEGCKTPILVRCPTTFEDFVAYFLGGKDDLFLDKVRDSLRSSDGETFPDGEPFPRSRGRGLPKWLEGVVFERKKQRFRVLRREIFEVYLVVSNAQIDDAETAHELSRHLIKMVGILLMCPTPTANVQADSRVRRYYFRGGTAQTDWCSHSEWQGLCAVSTLRVGCGTP